MVEFCSIVLLYLLVEVYSDENKQYTGGIDAAAVSPFGEAYSVAAMERAIADAYRNDGILGMYCNAQMVHEAVFGALPDVLPASLEAVIDSTQKTGADVSAVRQWCYEQTAQLLEASVPIPAVLHKRLSHDWLQPKEERPPSPRRTSDHWLDQLQAGIAGEIQQIEQAREAYVRAAQPETALWAGVSAENMRLGRLLNQTFAAALNRPQAGVQLTLLEQAQQAYEAGHEIESGDDSRLDYARRQAEDFLAQFKPAVQREIVRGAMGALYADEGQGGRPKSDTLLWLAGQQLSDGSRADGIGNMTARIVTERNNKA